MKKLLLSLILVSVTIGYSQNGNGNQGNKKDKDTTSSSNDSTMESAALAPPPDGGVYTWYRDFDGDSFGDPNSTIQADYPPSGYVGNTADCDDFDANVNPGESEILDGKDNDCDGQIDEGLNAPSTPSTPSISKNCGYTTLTRSTPPSGVTWYWQSSSSGTSTSNSSVSIDRYSGIVYYIRARDNGNGLWSSSRSVYYTIDNCTATAPSNESFESGLGDWTQDGSDDINWTRKSGSTTSSGTGPTAAENGSYYLYTEASSNTNKTARITSSTYNISQSQSMVFSYHMYGSSMGSLSLEVSANGGTTWTPLWTLSENQENAWKTATVNLSAYLDSDIKLRFTGITGSSYTSDISIDNIRFVTAGSCNNTILSNENYVYTRVYNEPRTTSPSSPGRNEVIEEVTYYDGLGRPKQQVGIGHAGGIQYEDIITTIQYDSFGRPTREYLPVPMEDCSPGTFRSGDMDYITRDYYNTEFVDDFSGVSSANPYSEKQLEASPRGQIEKQAAPGEAWKLGSGHEIEFDYQTNTGSEVRLYNVTFSNGNIQAPVLSGGSSYYDAGELFKIITFNENHSSGTGHSTEEFKNKKGQVILKRTYNGAIKHDTYYVYDDYGNLTYVLPPKSAATSGRPNSTKISELCYQYKYDDQDRLIEKKIPGKGWEYIVYNKLDQPVLAQDALLSSQNKWIFTKYDGLGRVSYTGYINNIGSRSSLQNTLDGANYEYENRQSSSFSLNGETVYYTNRSKPQTLDGLYTINYYDSYTYTNPGFSIPNSNEYGETIVKGIKTQGLTTVTKVKVLETSQWITTAMGYDEKGRLVWSKTTNPYLGTTDIMEHDLHDFNGNILNTKTTHQKTGENTVVIVDNYTYDHMNRLKEHTQSINGGASELIASNEYDKLGQLKNKKVGNSLGNPLQNVAYDYNVRGWLKQINDVNNTNKLFNFKLSYNNPSSGTALYNGNISRAEWRTDNTDSNLKNYRYYYDDLNRITSAIAHGSAYNLNGVTYDRNGNIETLSRGSSGAMDNLTYEYHNSEVSNRLRKVTDSGNSNGFDDGANTTNEYNYDTNGNLTSDLNKGISSITYNHLNLPETITISGQIIDYTYDATGVKLRKEIPGKVTDYAGGFVYEQLGTGSKELQFFSHPEGYVSYENGQFKYVYNYVDHLGNVRLSYTDGNGNGSIDPATEIIQEKNYYAFGLTHQGYNDSGSPYGNAAAKRYGFGGKELQDETFSGSTLDWYDISARNYDPALGRWMNIDPLAEQMRSHSPYNYAFNNPLRFTDPDGMAPEDLIIYYKDNDGNQQKFIYTGDNIHDSPDNKFVKNVLGAIFYNNSNGGGDALQSIAENKNIKVNISETEGYVNSGNQSNIFWNPSKGLLTEEGNVLSPATLLEHEAGHSLNAYKDKDKFDKDQATRDSDYGDKEERNVIPENETKTARANGEIGPNGISRNSHRGEPVIVESPSSNKVNKKSTYNFYRRLNRTTAGDYSKQLKKYKQ